MTGPTVQIPRAAAEAIAEFLHGDVTTGDLLDARSVLDAALTDAAEAAAWEPFRSSLTSFTAIGDESPMARSAHEQRAMSIVAAFARMGLDARDPNVIRPALAALAAVDGDARQHAGCLPPVRSHLSVVASGLADLAPSEAKR